MEVFQVRHPLLQLNSLFFLGSGLVRAGKELKVGGCDATRAGRRGVKRSSTWGSEEEEIRVTGESKQAGQEEQETVKHGSQCLEDWRAMALSGPNHCTGRLLPGKCVWAALPRCVRC